MPRGSNTQTRTFNYLTGTTVGIDLLSGTNPENGTVTYTYNSDHSVHTKTDAKGQVFTYSYDSYKRLTQIMVGSTVLRNFIYDTNTLDTTGYSGTYTQGRLVAVQNSAFTPQGYMAGQGGSNVTVPSNIQFIEMFDYAQSGLVLGKRLQVQETFHWYVNNVLQTSNQTLNLDGAYTYDTGGEGKVLSVTYPKTYSWNGTLVANPGPTYTYAFDAMMRPTGLTDQNNSSIVNNVTYNAANQLLTFNTETHQYNNLNQMTRLTITGNLDISYNFPAGTNDGKISSQKDNMSGETVTYQYDSLNRLLSASSTQSWSETYGFDGFGNLLSKTGTGGAPTLSQSVTASNNHIVGQGYDSNGNQTSGPLGSVSYDAENRIASVSSAGVQYAYDSRNKRIWSSTLTNGNLAQNFYYYGIDGQKLGIYQLNLVLINNVTPVMTESAKLSTFFGGKRIGTYDRLGTAKYDDQNGAGMSFYPYGEDRGAVQPNDSLKFATYTRDSATGLDYADQRYYASNFGRFMRPDPAYAGGIGNPQSLNLYSYVNGDPANAVDPGGLCDVIIGGLTMKPYDSDGLDNFASPLNAIEVFPYSDDDAGAEGFVNGLLKVVGQAFDNAFNDLSKQTQLAVAGIIAASQDPGSINVFTYSAGAQTFNQAYAFLEKYLPDIASRINNVTYISPGSIGSTLASGNGTTTAILGTGTAEQIITAFSVLDPGADIDTNMNCKHGDVSCAFNYLAGLKKQLSGSACTKTYNFFLSPRPPVRNPSNYNYFYWMLLSYQSTVQPTPVVVSTITFAVPQ